MTIRDTVIMLGLCLVFSFMGFHLGSYKAKAELYEGFQMGELEPIVNEIINQHMAFVPALK